MGGERAPRARSSRSKGDPAAPLEEALVLEERRGRRGLRAAFEAGVPSSCAPARAEAVKAALARPEVACVVVPEHRADLLELDLTELTYG